MYISKSAIGKFSASILIYMSFTGLLSGLKLFSSHLLISGILTVIYGITGFAAAAGIILSSSWTLLVSAIWSETLLLRLLNAEYLIKKHNTILTNDFIISLAFVSLLISFLIYYINNTTRAYCFCSNLPKDRQSPKISTNITFAFILFLLIDYLIFLIPIIFITQDFFAIVTINCLLMILPNLIISKYLIAPLRSLTISISFWIISFVLLISLIAPFGTYGIPITFRILRTFLIT